MKKLLLLTAMMLMYSFAFSQISITETHTNVSCFGGSNGAIAISVTGGTAPYTYSWTPGSSGPTTLTGLPSGQYIVTIEDVAMNTSSLSITITEPSLLVATTTATNELCYGVSSGAIDVIASGGTPPYLYNLAGGPYASTSLFSNQPAGTQLVSVKDGNNCVTTQTAQVIPTTLFTASITSVNNVTCFGLANGNASASPIGGIGGPYTYSWVPSGQTSATANGLTPGTYTVTITNFGGCTATVTVNILQPTQLSSTITSTNVSCNGACDGAFNINASGGVAPYTFSTTSLGFAGANNFNQCASIQTITTTDANNCVFINAVTITQPPMLTAITSATNSNCGQANGVVCATVTGGTGVTSYLWSTGNTLLCNSNVTAGAYTFTVTDANGCMANASGLVNDIAGPTVSITSYTHVTCFNGTNGGATSSVTGGIAPYIYSWGPFGGSTPSITGVTAGLYNLTVTDNAGCVGTVSVQISQPTQLNIAMSFTNATCNMCDGQVSAVVSGGNPVYWYNWAPTPGAGPNVNGLCTGNYTLSITDVNGCVKTSTISVFSAGTGTLAGLTTTLTPVNESCLNSNDGSIDLTIGGSNPGPFTYQWNNGSTGQDIFNIGSGNYDVTIFDSGMNCLTVSSSISAIGTNCGNISGNIFIDNNADCVNNSGDSDFQSAMVIANPGNRYGYTDALGNYSITNLMYGTYTLSLNSGSSLYVPTCTTSIISNINAGIPNSINNDFSAGLNSTTQPDMRVFASSNNMAPGFLCSAYYSLSNMNNVSGTGLLKVTIPSSFITAISNATPSGYSISGDTVIWNFNNITYASGSIAYSIQFVVPLTTPLGSTFTTCINADPNITDFDYANNSDCYSRLVTGSFDPNDKTVSPVGFGPYNEIHPNETDLTYLIRFQNTGNGPAVNIVVKDTLSPNVDVTTFEMLSASHNYNIDILPGNVLRWKFNNIMLADSGSNEPASHGYIQYRIKHTVANFPGTQIKNTAYIYFDFNAPIVTNTAMNTIEYVTGIQSQNLSDDQWLVYPNPSSGILNLINNNIAVDTKLKIEVINSFGQLVYEENATANHKTLDISKISNGVYFVKIISEKQSCIKRVVLSK